jgi:polyhydroxybutyrate depolymerase
MKRALVLVLVALTAACSGSPPAAVPQPSATVTLPPENPRPGDQSTAFLDDGGRVWHYLVHAPESYRPGQRYPLVLVFHGRPGTPEDMVELTGMNDVADANEFLVVYPQSMFDPAAVSALLDHLVATWSIDQNHIHAAGFSRGGSLVYRLASELPERFGSVAPVSASASGDVSLLQPLSLMTFQGTGDGLRVAWPTTNAAWDTAAGCSDGSVATISLPAATADVSSKTCADGTEHVVYTVAGMGHTWPAGASGLIWDFFARHPLA